MGGPLATIQITRPRIVPRIIRVASTARTVTLPPAINAYVRLPMSNAEGSAGNSLLVPARLHKSVIQTSGRKTLVVITVILPVVSPGVRGLQGMNTSASIPMRISRVVSPPPSPMVSDLEG